MQKPSLVNRWNFISLVDSDSSLMEQEKITIRLKDKPSSWKPSVMMLLWSLLIQTLIPLLTATRSGQEILEQMWSQRCGKVFKRISANSKHSSEINLSSWIIPPIQIGKRQQLMLIRRWRSLRIKSQDRRLPKIGLKVNILNLKVQWTPKWLNFSVRQWKRFQVRRIRKVLLRN